MSIKALSLAAAAVAVTASAASADSYFGFGQTLDAGSAVEINLVTAESNGVLEIYNYAGGQTGELLGSTPVNAGANADVRVGIAPRYLTDVIAVLKVNGEVVATQDYDIDNG